MEFWENSLNEELKKKKKGEITPEFIIALNNWAIFRSIENCMKAWDERYQKLRDKLGEESIESVKSIMKFQMNFGLLVSDLVQIILPNIQSKLKQLKLYNQDQIMQECVMMVGGDTPRLLELETVLEQYMGEKYKPKEITDEDVKKNLEKTIGYCKLIEDGKIDV